MQKMGLATTIYATATSSIDVKAVKATTEMFNALAKIANSPANNPLTQLSTNLFKAIKELTEVVNNLEESVGTQQTASSAFAGIISSVGDRIGLAKEKIQENAAAATGGQSLDIEPLILAIETLEDRLNQPIYTIEVED
jgi:hypothetical protein